MKDPYDVLSLERSATQAEIKSAFRKLGAKHHPDRNPGDDDAVARFKEINAAYQILSDPKKRAMFDRFGAAGLGGAGGPGGPFQGGGIDFTELNVDGLFGDLLEALGIRVGDRGDLQQELVLDFEEAAFGCKKTLSYQRIDACDTCGGSGAAKGTKLSQCPTCRGQGRVRLQQGVLPIAVERPCPDCRGTGSLVESPCKDCRGNGSGPSETELEIKIPPGTDNGATLRVEGAGNRPRNKRPGALQVLVRVKEHELFRRSGDNVVCSLPITFPQAVLGDEIEIPTLEGKGLMRIPAGTQPGTILRVRGRGIPKRVMGGRGDQLVEIRVEVPTELSQHQKELISELGEALGEAVQPQRRTFMDKLGDLFS